jgi:tetratricopeptide (TPR) repeat protein
VLRDVLRVLRRPQDNAVVLYGQRRIGKTSILQHLAAWLSRRGPFRPVYFDLQDKAAWPLDRVLQELARTVAYALGQPEPDLGSDPATAFRRAWLPAVLDGLPEGCSLVLLFDEFDVLADPSAEQAAAAFFPYLRGLLDSDRGRLQFIFVIGRNVGDLDTIALSLFKGTAARRVSLLSREDTVNLVRLSESNGTLSWADEAVEQVWRLTCGHPFLTQQLCSHVWEHAYDEEPNEPTAVLEDVNRAVAGALEASRNALEWLWDGLPPAERVVASALAEAGSDPITQDGLEQLLHESGVRVVIRELQNAPELLQDWDLLEPVDGGYRFRVELLRQWIVEHKPLKRVQEELDRIAPIAESLYQAALGLYRNEQLDLAVDSLRQAVGLNPNHVRANQLLADILLAQGQPSEAQRLLERLFEYQPAAARPRLVQALLAQSQATEDEGEQLALYERVLDLDPAQPEAIAGRRFIWQCRGDAKLADGDLEAALEAYQSAGLVDKAAEVEQDMRRRNLAVQLEELEALEQDNRYQDALELARRLADEYAEVRDWPSELVRLKKEALLADMYQRALGALHTGDRQTAQDLLAKVVALDAGYGDATRYLHMAVTGVDVAGLQADLVDEEDARQRQEQQLLELRAQLETGRGPEQQAGAVVENRGVLHDVRFWWAALMQALGAGLKAAYGAVERGRTEWLVSTLIWLPLFIPTLAMRMGTLSGAGHVPPTAVYSWLIVGLMLAWILTGCLGKRDRDNKAAVSLVTVVSWGLALVAAGSVLGGLVIDLLSDVPSDLLGTVLVAAVLVVAQFIAASGASSSIADLMADAMATAIAAGVATAMIFVIAILIVFVVAVGVVHGEPDLMVIGVICAIGGGVISSITAGVARSTKGAWAMLVLALVFLFWFSFLRGSHAFQKLV